MNSTFIVALFMIGNLVGSGFFMLPSVLAPVGSNLIYSWSIAGFMAIMFALMFGRLYLLFPKSSVVSDYFQNTFVKKAIALVYWISCIIGNAGVLIVVVASLNMPNPLLVGSIVMLLLTLPNALLAYENIAKIEVILTVLKFAILAVLPVALFFLKPDMFVLPQKMGSNLDVAYTGISCFWAFLGIETAGVFGSGKSAKRGLLIGVLSCIALYIITSLLIASSVPRQELASASMPFSLFVSTVLGSGYEKYISFIVAFTAFGALYGWIAATSKMSLIYAKNKIFPKSFLKPMPSGTSFHGLTISSIASFLLFWAVSGMDTKGQFSFVIDLTVYITFIIFALCAFVLFKKGKQFSDKLIAMFCITSVLISLAFDFKMTLIASIVFLLSIFALRFFSFKKAS